MRTTHWRTSLALAICAAFLFAACTKNEETPRPPARPDVVLITIDALRPDHLGTYGYHRDTSPNIDAIAKTGVVFETAVSQAGYTVPSVAALLTGNLPLFAGEKHEPRPLDAKNDTLAEVLGRAGYDTAAFVDNGLLNRLGGWEQGFGTFRCIDEDEAKLVTGLALELLAETRGKPLFLWLHYLDPHSPYKDRPAYYEKYKSDTDDKTWFKSAEVDDDRIKWNDAQTQNAINLYDGEIRYTDEHLGRLFDALKKRARWGETMLVLTADHGEAFMERGHKSHGYDVYDENIRVPLIVLAPGESRTKTAGARRDGVVRIMDLFPTILDYAGVRGPAVQGQSLRPLAEGAAGWTEKAAFSQASSGDFSARLSDHKVMFRHATNDFVWFDLKGDPGEKSPRAWDGIPVERRAAANSLKKKLEAYLRAWGADRLEGAPADLDPETRDALKNLGYLRE